MPRFFCLSIFGLICLVSDVTAQNRNTIDSLVVQLSQATALEKVDIWGELAMVYSGSQPEKSRQYADSALQSAEQIPYEQGKAKALTALGYYYMDMGDLAEALTCFQKGLQIDRSYHQQKGIANQLNAIAHIHMHKNDYKQALDYFQESLMIEKEINNPKGISQKYHNIGIIYKNLSMYPEALSYFLQALTLNEQFGYDSKILINLRNIGWVHYLREDYTKALPYFQKSLTIGLSTGDSASIAHIYNDLGLIHQSRHEPDSALTYFRYSLALNRRLNIPSGIAVALANMADIYHAMDSLKKAVAFNEKSLKIQKEINDQYNRAIGLHRLALIYFTMNDYRKALATAKASEELAQKIRARKTLEDVKGTIARIYATLEDHEKAYQYQADYSQLKDSLYKEAKARHFEEMEIRYKAEKKDRQIELLNNEKSLQQAKISRQILLRDSALGALVLLGLSGFLVLRNVRIRARHQRQLLVQQQQLNLTKSRFFTNIAHEFRTPLTLILGPAEQIHEQTTDSHIQQHIRLIQRNAKQLLGLINQILDLSKVESNMVQLEPVAGDLIAFLKGITFSFESLAQQKKITIQFCSGFTQITTSFDHDKLEKIFKNLLSNAFKFTPDGGAIIVTVSLPATNRVSISVADNGFGISPEHLPHIFDRFYQADDTATRRAGGTGIGLALTRELVELHGGQISAQSLMGQGTTFEVMLPIKPLHVSASVPMDAGSTTLENTVSDREETTTDKDTDDTSLILVIEDNPDVRAFIHQVLSKQYKVIEAERGHIGVALAYKHIPDLIISDVMMPEMDGYQVCQVLKENEKTSHVPIILLTAKAGLESRLEGLDTGADDYLAKPFNTRELLIRVRNLITIRQKLRERYNNEEFLNESKTALPPAEDAFLKKLRQIVEAHLDDEEFSIEDLSREVGMSRTQIHRKLKALTGLSASLFMRQIRLQHAVRLLQQTDFSISEVAFQVGFSSPAYFTRCFTEQFRQVPSALRKHKH